jgi:DNA-binding response OmpR family regulator
MAKDHIMVVEDDLDIANMLRIYFTGHGYQVHVANKGEEALAMTRQQLPSLIVLDILLPDMDGYAVCKQLRTNSRTNHIPIIFLSQKDERGDRIAGLELGADDYITKPFDIEELRLRVQNAIARSERESLTDPRTGLPGGGLIEQQVEKLIRRTDWALLDCQLEHFDDFREVYGFMAADDLLRDVAILLNDVLEQTGNGDDFLGHAGGGHFLLITSAAQAEAVRDLIWRRAPEHIQQHYTAIDLDRGHLLFDRPGEPDQKAEMMSLSVGMAVNSEHVYTDVQEIVSTARTRRRQPEYDG